jgi:CHAT domain-containing protein
LVDSRDWLLSVTFHLPKHHTVAYPHVWNSKAAVGRILKMRNLAAHSTSDEATRRDWHDYLAARRRLDQLLRQPLPDQAKHDRLVRDLFAEKDELESRLARNLPQLHRQKEMEETSPAHLTKALPQHSVFIDLLGYIRSEQDNGVKGVKGLTRTRCFVAFVLAPGRNPVRVELGPAEDIDQTLFKWRQAVEGWDAKVPERVRQDLREAELKQAAKLRQLLWEPLAKHLPEGTRRIYLSPDGGLWRLPFLALPGAKPDSVLLDEYTFAVVPHGPFLLEELMHPRKYEDKLSTVLAVGAVAYDVAGQGTPSRGYAELKGTAREVDQIKALVGERELAVLSKDKATADEVWKLLPRTRFAHLATHGFFNATDLGKERARLNDYWMEWRGQESLERKPVGLGIRNPLGYVGLVLAGANHPDKAGSDGGILSGFRIAELKLDGLQLAVLSACETGLGSYTSGEGVEGVQRAFHLAGCANVVSSLWKVNDDATAALMVKMYHELWQEGKEPVEALRQAQLLVYRRPDLLADLKGERGPPKQKDAVKIDGAQAGEPSAAVEGLGKRTPTKLWAAFVLSGLGR